MIPELHARIPARIRFIEGENEQGGSTTPPETPGGETPPAGDSETPPADGETPPAGDGTPAGGEEQESTDPAFLKKELERTRRESANYRTQLREAQDKLTGAKTPEEVAAATKELVDKLAASDTALTRERVARKTNLPDELAARLVGTTEAELMADAKALAKLVQSKPEVDPDDLDGGLTPSREGKFDPVAEARKARRSRY